MNILEINRNTLANLYEQFPETFEGLRIQGEYLVFGNEACDIAHFNLYDLIEGNNSFSASLDSLTAEDVFKIIRLHTIAIQSKDYASKELEQMRYENPLLAGVTIVPRNEITGEAEIINIIDSNGKDNTFTNTYQIDFFDAYEDLKRENDSRLVTPEDLIAEVNRRISLVQNNMGDSLLEEQEIDKTVLYCPGADYIQSLLRNEEELSDRRKRDIESYFHYLGDAMKYEEYLLPEVMDKLNEFRSYILSLNGELENGNQLTANEMTAIDKSVELEEEAQKDKGISQEKEDGLNPELTNARTLKLERKYNSSSEGFISTFVILVCIIVVVIILTIVTLTLI